MKGELQPWRPRVWFQLDFWFRKGLSDVNPGNLRFVVILVCSCCINKLPVKLSTGSLKKQQQTPQNTYDFTQFLRVRNLRRARLDGSAPGAVAQGCGPLEAPGLKVPFEVHAPARWPS